MEENIRDCLSKLIQLRFYWLSCHATRAFFIGALDEEINCEYCKWNQRYN